MNRYAYTYNNPVMGIDPSGYKIAMLYSDRIKDPYVNQLNDDYIKKAEEYNSILREMKNLYKDISEKGSSRSKHARLQKLKEQKALARIAKEDASIAYTKAKIDYLKENLGAWSDNSDNTSGSNNTNGYSEYYQKVSEKARLGYKYPTDFDNNETATPLELTGTESECTQLPDNIVELLNNVLNTTTDNFVKEKIKQILSSTDIQSVSINYLHNLELTSDVAEEFANSERFDKFLYYDTLGNALILLLGFFIPQAWNMPFTSMKVSNALATLAATGEFASVLLHRTYTQQMI